MTTSIPQNPSAPAETTVDKDLAIAIANGRRYWAGKAISKERARLYEGTWHGGVRSNDLDLTRAIRSIFGGEVSGRYTQLLEGYKDEFSAMRGCEDIPLLDRKSVV